MMENKLEYSGLNEYLKREYGHKVYKVSLNGGFTCPNRDGRIDTRGCIFCSKGGSGEFASDPELSIKEQLDEGISRIENKLPKHEKCTYIAYFQAFTNTYAPVSKLRALYLEAIEDDRVEILSVATRPDCLGSEVLELLSEMNEIKPVWVELGLQTIHAKTASYIRRGYPLAVYDKAVSELKERNIKVITHVILGLPGESVSDMLETVRYVAATETFGIKLQLLHILKNTDLYDEYLSKGIRTLEQEEYIDILKQCISVIPRDMIIHRLTGDGDKRLLAAPMWSADKKQVLNEMNRHFMSK